MGKVCSFRKGYGIAKDDLSSDGTPCILYGELYTTYKTAIAKTIKSKTSIQSKSLVYSQKDDVIIPCSGETAEDIATSIWNFAGVYRLLPDSLQQGAAHDGD